MLAKTPVEMGENMENFLDALNAFERKPSREIPKELEELLCRIARNGEPLFPWSKLKPLVVTKLENVIQEYIQSNPCEEVPMLPNVENVKFDDMRERLMRSLNAFNSAPFTMQRLCELLTHPKRYYQRSDKFMRGVEKNVQVVSTITPAGKRITHSCEVRNPTLMMNGIPSDTHTQTTTVSSESQPVETTPSSDETNHTNGNTAISSQSQEVIVPQPNDAVVCSPASEQDVDSTRQYANASVSKPVMDTSERTSSSDDSILMDGVKESKGTSEHNEAEACKMMEVENRTGIVDSDDSDGNKGDVDQDSCSSMDSADSGGSSPDSALPPGTGFFGSLHREVTTPDQKDQDTVDSSSCSATAPPMDEDKSTSGPSSMPQPDQSHYSISPPALGREQSSPPPPPPPPPSISSAGVVTTDTRTNGQGEVASIEGKSPSEASNSEAQFSEVVISDRVTSDAVTSDTATADSATSEVVTSEAVTSEAVTSEAVTSVAVTSEAVTSELVTSEVVTSKAVTSEVVTSEAATSEAATSEAATSEAATSEAATSEAVTSEAVTSEAVTSEAVTSEAVTSEAVTSETLTAKVAPAEATTAEALNPTASSTETSGEQSTSEMTVSTNEASAPGTSTVSEATCTSEAMTTELLANDENKSQEAADQSEVNSGLNNVCETTPMEQD